MTTIPIQDTIDLVLRAEQVIVNKTVKLVTTVVAMVTGDTTEAALRTEIKAVMKALVDAEWQFSNIERNTDQSGWERVTLIASVRVPETENYNLDKRATLASRPGLSITVPVTVDTTVPQSLVDEAESNLRLTLIASAKTEQAKIGGALELDYRIHRLVFESVQARSMTSNRISAMSAKASGSYGSGFSDEEDSLGNASKLSMLARLSLARVVG